MFLCLKSVIPAKAGIQKPALEGLNRGSLILKELDSRLRTPAYDMRGQASGMTFLDFCKSLCSLANFKLWTGETPVLLLYFIENKGSFSY